MTVLDQARQTAYVAYRQKCNATQRVEPDTSFGSQAYERRMQNRVRPFRGEAGMCLMCLMAFQLRYVGEQICGTCKSCSRVK